MVMVSGRIWTLERREVAFWAMVDSDGDCLVWTGHINSDGYGTASLKNRDTKAHRLAYKLTVGEIPERLMLDHLCRNRACVNPQHLEVVTNRENVVRGLESRGVCKNGHPRHPALTLTWLDSRTQLGYTTHCKLCRYINKNRDTTELKRAAGLTG